MRQRQFRAEVGAAPSIPRRKQAPHGRQTQASTSGGSIGEEEEEYLS